MAPSEVDFYKILSIGRYATDDDIKKAFRKAARDTHPDKNPDDPLAKEKFQELQRAYDTLKDQLERSKYDEDNSYHGLPEGSRPKPKSSTAQRYAASTGPTGPTGSTGPTPGWTTGSASFPRGFAQQAHGAPGTRHTGAHKTTYEDFTGSTYGGARKQRSGYDYSSNYRKTPQPPPPKPAHFDDNYESYDQYSRSYHRPESPRRESAYTRTSQRQTNATPAGTPKPTASTRKAYSTVGGQRDPGAQAPDFNIGAYIKERRAKEEEQARRDDEARQREEEKRKREEAAIRAARKEEHRARDEERARRRAEERRAEMAEEIRRAEEEARITEEEEEAARRRSHWAQADNQFSRNEYVRPDPPLFPGSKEEDIMRTVDERLAEGQRKSKSASTTASRSHPRRSPTKSKVRREGEHGTSNGNSDGWSKSGNISDHSGSFHHSTPADDGEELSYHEKILRKAKAEQQREQQQEQQRRWEDMLRGKDGSKSHQGHGRTKSETQPRDIPNTSDRPRTSGHESPISGAPKRESPSADTSNNKRRNNSAEFRFKFDEVPPGPGMARVDSYRSEPRVSPPPPGDSPFQKKPDYRFHGEVPNPFNYTTPEELSQQNQNNLYASTTFTRPQSQPVYPTQPQHVPVPRPTPQPQQQQQRQQQQQQQQQQRQQQSVPQGFQKDLWDTLAQTASLFDYHPSPQKKTSTTSFSKFRTRSKDSVNADGGYAHVGINVGPGTSGEERSGSTESKHRGAEAHVPVAGDDGFEPMDTGPDTGIPDPINIQASAKLNGHTSPRANMSPMGNLSPRIPTPLSPSASKDSGLDTMGNLGSVHPLKDNGLDNMSGIATVPPFSRSPADVGLGGLGDLKDNLPFPSRASHTPKPDLTGQLPKFKRPELRDLYVPTPAESPFYLPIPPKIPKTPKLVDLNTYNIFFGHVETYVAHWNNYEEKVHQLQTELCGKGFKATNPTGLDISAINEYIKRVKEKDLALENKYRESRERHMDALEDWMKYRSAVVDKTRK